MHCSDCCISDQCFEECFISHIPVVKLLSFHFKELSLRHLHRLIKIQDISVIFLVNDVT